MTVIQKGINKLLVCLWDTKCWFGNDCSTICIVTLRSDIFTFLAKLEVAGATWFTLSDSNNMKRQCGNDLIKTVTLSDSVQVSWREDGSSIEIQF